MKYALSLIFAILAATTLNAHELTVGDLTIIHPHINAPAKGAKAAAGYVAIVNDGTQTEHLLGVEASFAQLAQVHNSSVDANGVATMAPVDTVEIPAGETVVLEPGALHIMLMGLTQNVNEGEMLPATLIFEIAGRVDITFMILKADGTMAEMDHSKMEQTTPGN